MSDPKLVGSAPILLVGDMNRALVYYRERVGFNVDNLYGDPTNFAILSRDGFRLCLSLAHARHIVPHFKVVPGMWNAYFWVAGIDALFSELKGRGATIDYGLENKGYSVREFGIQDADGYDIAFGELL